MLTGKIIAAVFALTKGASATIGASINSQGFTEIFGNSFGRPGTDASYDYVIVGGGTAGNTIAARLALDPANYTVAVIEAGNFYEVMSGNLTQIPGYNFESAEPNFASGGLASLTAIGVPTVPQVGYNNRSILFTVGQTFGGGSAANYGGYIRSTVGAFDWWADIVGDDYWNWNSVYPFFKKSVNFTPPDFSKIDPSLNITFDPSAFEATGGPLHVSYGNFQGPYGPFFEEGLVRTGFEANLGDNSGKLIGYGASTGAVNPRTATRDTSETSFLQTAARASSGLKIYPETLAKQIVFDKNKKATGVVVQGNLRNIPLTWQLNATKEVIVSGGLWFSPALLMVSGIGPSATLAEHGIETIVDLPGVGQNERDSPYMTLVFKVNTTTNTQFIAGNLKVVEQVVSDYLEHQSGRLSSIGTGQALAWEKFPENLRSKFSNSTLEWLSNFPADWPEVQYLPLESSSFPADLGPDDNYISLGSALLSTLSIGNMTIPSNDTVDLPIISPNWLLNTGDQQMAVAAFKRIREIAGNTSIVESEYIPGPSVSTDEEILEWLKDNMNLIYHGASTCKMGSTNDTTAVLDSRARVRGVTGLRVVDASAFPNLPPGYPMSSVYMFAEAIANSILTGN